MRGAICRTTGEEKIEIVEDLTVADPGPGQVKVRIHAAGICHSDLSGMNGNLPQGAPFVPGHEGSGEITAVGDGVTSSKVGDHVIVAWTPPCGKCKACLRGQPNLCVDIFFAIAGSAHFKSGGEDIFGFAGTGTWAEELILPEQGVVVIPDDVPYEIGALIGCGVTTGVGAAVNTARVEVGSSVVVFGCGGVGISAIQGAKIGGARRIIAVDQFENKLAMAKRFGATDTIDASHTDALKEIRAMTGGGVDYAFEAVGLKKLAEQCFDATKTGGTAVIIGMIPVGQKVEIDGPRLLTERTLKGSMMGSNRFRIDMPRYIDFYLQGRLNLDDMVSKRAKLENINEAFASMKRGEVARTVLMFD